MTNRFNKSIKFLLFSLHEARKKPFENINKWLILQEHLIKKIIYVENQIRKLKSQKKEINRQRKNPKKKISKEVSKELKHTLDQIDSKINDYHRVIEIYESIGDGIAFTFICKFDIKPQNFKESPGFISGKSGLINERKFLKYAFTNNVIAIFNDITSVLKYADITLITKDGFKAIEVKTSLNTNQRTKRQEEKAERLYRYLEEDIVQGLYSKDNVFQRVEIGNEVSYVNQFNELINKTNYKGITSSCFEKGMLCIVAYNLFDKKVLNEIVSKSNFQEAIPFHLNMNKFSGLGYYPFSLSFEKPEYYVDFLNGKLNIMMLIDFKAIKEIAMNEGLETSISQEEEWAFDFKNISNDFPVKMFKMSVHFFHRSFMEFTSIEWLVKNSIQQFMNANKNKKYENL